MSMRELVEELNRRRARVAELGGPAAVARQHQAGKLTARERLALLFDAGSVVELGAHATHHAEHPSMAGRETPADGVVTGFGRIEGRPACFIAYDFTVMAGSMGRTGETKCARVRETALTQRVPLVWLIDSAGARIQEAAGGGWFASSGYLFRDEVILSGVVPLVAAMMGPGAAGRRTSPGSPTSSRWSEGPATWRSAGRRW
jgi:acetyl-CoA carboxylase carboxyltransferase component